MRVILHLEESRGLKFRRCCPQVVSDSLLQLRAQMELVFAMCLAIGKHCFEPFQLLYVASAWATATGYSDS